MNTSRLLPCAAGIAAAALTLAGCSANGTSLGTAPSAGQAAARASHPNFITARAGLGSYRPDRGASRMQRVDAKQALLYVSDISTATVQVFAYPQGKNVGTLTGFTYPQGECSDAKGNVYITDTFSSTIFEYAHGGTAPINVLSDPGEDPVGCAVDPASGDLAVANLLSAANFEVGGVSVYPGASGSPAIYVDPNNAREYFLDYDTSGTIYVDGVNSHTGAFQYAKMTPDGTFTDIKIKGVKLTFPGGVQSLGTNMLVGDQEGPIFGKPDIYQVTPSGSVASHLALETASGGRFNDLVQFTLTSKGKKGRNIVGPDALGANAYLAAYPTGRYISSFSTNLVQPLGTALSSPK